MKTSASLRASLIWWIFEHSGSIAPAAQITVVAISESFKGLFSPPFVQDAVPVWSS